MSVAAQADLRPLFHVFGILPQDSLAVQDSLTQSGVLPSIAIYNRLHAYFDLIPEDNAAFVNYALSVYPNLYTDGPTEAPEYGVGWHYLKSLTYNAAEAQARTAILQSIINQYFPNGAPTGNETPDVCCLLDTMHVNLVNEEVFVTGGVRPYNISIDITPNVKTITVVDYDGCVSTAQYIINSLSEEGNKSISIYPNPASTTIHIDLPDNSNSIERLLLISMNGQVLKEYRKPDQFIDISTLSDGVFILEIELAGGEQINKKVVILK